MGSRHSGQAALLVGVGLSYALLASFAIALTRLSGGIALLWLANAPLIGALCSYRASRWPTIVMAAAVGAMCATLLTAPTPWLAPVSATINVGDGVLASMLLRRLGVAETRFATMGSIARFVLAAVIVAPIVSGLFGAALASIVLHLHYGSALFDWVVGRGTGTLIGAPLALQIGRKDIDWRTFHARRGTSKAILTAAFGIATSWFVFHQTQLPLLFLPMVPLIAGTFLFQRFGAAVGILVVATIGGVLTVQGHGPINLMHAPVAARLQFFQFYLAVLFLIALPVAATLVQRDKLLAQLGESEARYRLLADHATDIMLTLEPDGTIRFASPAIRELGHFDPESLVGTNAVDLVHADDRDRVRKAHLQALAQPERTFSVEYRGVKATGEAAWFETNTRAVRGADGRISAVVSVIRDLARRKEREAELERAASTDPLTGLLNRASFRARVDQAMGRVGQPSTLALLDLDHFKRVNDTHGHATGDAALLMLADLLRENLRAEDAIGRIGGEEFAILFAGLPLAASAMICDRLREVLAAQAVPTPDGAGLHITMSIGLNPLDRGQEVDALFAGADAALYAAKANGRDRTEVAVS